LLVVERTVLPIRGVASKTPKPFSVKYGIVNAVVKCQVSIPFADRRSE